MKGPNKMVGSFQGKPETWRYWNAIDAFVRSLGGVTVALKAQVSYSVKRKFLWMWAYEKTADPHFHSVEQVGKNRWNHRVEVKEEETAASAWLHSLLAKGYRFTGK
ncbi:MAG: DUF5655 domain-containing protein [Oscillospiraceae bacterium]